MRTGFTLACLCICFLASAQNAGIGTNTPHPSAMLDITSTNKGILIPRVSSLPSNPATGLMVYYSSNFYYYNGTEWRIVGQDEIVTTSYFAPKSNTLSNLASLDSLGNSIARQSNYFLIGAPGKAYGAAAKGGQVFTGRLVDNTNRIILKPTTVAAASVPQAGDGFGTAVAATLTGYDMVVGAPYRDAIGTNSGAVYYANSTTDPGFDLLPVPGTISNYDNLGKSVAIATSDAGVLIVAGAPGDDGNLGAVYTWFEPAGGSMAYKNRLFGSNVTADQFGFSVALSMDDDGNAWLFVGSPFAPGAGSQRGRIDIYRRNTSTSAWTFFQSITGTTDDGKMGYCVGHARSFARQLLSVGQPGRTFGVAGVSPTVGYVNNYRFDTTGNTWVATGTVAPSGSNNAGESVHLVYNGSTIELVTGHSKGMNAGYIGSNFGVANYYKSYNNGQTWLLQRKLIDLDGEPGYDFGKAVHIYANGQILVGAPGAIINGVEDAGQVMVFKEE